MYSELEELLKQGWDLMFTEGKFQLAWYDDKKPVKDIIIKGKTISDIVKRVKLKQNH